MMAQLHDSSDVRSNEQNALLRHIDTADYATLAEHFEDVPARAGAILVERDARPTHVYFPQSGVASLVAVFEGGSLVEVGTVGREGIVGVPVFLGTATAPFRVLMQIEGVVRQVPVQVFESVLAGSSSFDAILRRYVDAYLLQVSQTAACNRMHDLSARAARWLLMTHDRVGDTFALTHEFLAIMLGVRRAGVSETAAELQRKGAIRYTRGRVTIVDRIELERQACECYRTVRTRFDAMLPARDELLVRWRTAAKEAGPDRSVITATSGGVPSRNGSPQ